MFRRAATTLVLLTRQTILRADFSGGANPTLLGTWSEPRPGLDDLPSLVEAALVLGPKPGRKVWVLATDLWTQTLAMALRSTAKLSEEDLTRALSFEVETLSGISAFESVVGYTPVPSNKENERCFWVLQVRSGDRDQIDEIVRKAGSKLGGIGHPGGLPVPLTPAEEGDPSWQRVELWPDVIVCLHGAPPQPVQVHLINADPQQERWHAEEEDWRNRMGSVRRREMLLTSGELVTFKDDGQPALHEEAEPARLAWLTAWAKELNKGTVAVPLVRPLPQPMSDGLRLAIAGCLAAVLAGLCWGHYVFAQLFQLAPARAEIRRLQEPIQLMADLDQQASKLDKDLAELRKQTEALRQTNDTLLAQRQRLARLLAALAEHLPDDLLIQKIDGDIGAPCIHGLCLRESQANQFAARLAQALPGDWQVKETRLKAQEKFTNGAPFAFQVHLSLVGPANVPTTKNATPPTGRRANYD